MSFLIKSEIKKFDLKLSQKVVDFATSLVNQAISMKVSNRITHPLGIAFLCLDLAAEAKNSTFPSELISNASLYYNDRFYLISSIYV